MRQEPQVEQHQSWLMRQIDGLALRLYQILYEYPVDPIEFGVSWHAIFYGGWLMWPYDTFGASPSFRDIRQFVPEAGAGTAFLLVGLIWLAGLLVRQRMLRIGGSAAATFLYCYWTIMLGRANFQSLAWVTYGVFALFAAWSINRNYRRMLP